MKKGEKQNLRVVGWKSDYSTKTKFKKWLNLYEWLYKTKIKITKYDDDYYAFNYDPKYFEYFRNNYAGGVYVVWGKPYSLKNLPKPKYPFMDRYYKKKVLR